MPPATQGDEVEDQSKEDISDLIEFLKKSEQTVAKNLAEQISNFSTTTNRLSEYQFKGSENLKALQPGWRHENDKDSIHLIAIYPTPEELDCKMAPFLPEISKMFGANAKPARYFDWAFRLLREDVLRAVADDLYKIERFKSKRVEVTMFDSFTHEKHFDLCFSMSFKEPQRFENQEERNRYWKRRRNFLKEQSVLALFRGETLFCLGIVTWSDLRFATPKVKIALFGKPEIHRIFTELNQEQTSLRAVQLSTKFFSYIPVLERLQNLSDLPFREEILHYQGGNAPSYWDSDFENRVRQFEIGELKLTKKGEEIVLDSNQKDAIISSLKRRVALIQGPPGTGKSFCGAIIARLLHDFTKEMIMCVCYTNHALDQFLNDLIEFGLPESELVRIGGLDRISDQMQKFTVQNLLKESGQAKRAFRHQVKRHEDKMKTIVTQIWKIHREKLVYLHETELFHDFSAQLSDAEREAFVVPRDDDGYQIAGKRNKLIRPDYLWRQWILGRDRGSLKDHFKRDGKTKSSKSDDLWSRSKRKERLKLLEKWRRNLLMPVFDELDNLIKDFNETNQEIRDLDRQKIIDLLKSKRIIGCTSTGAASHAKELDAVNAGILIIEEAGELLEPHVITSLSTNCKSLIMIGDHKQLRPKLNAYDLTVESRSPYEFNRSLFERLIVINKFPHATLELQHRMRPEFSRIIRRLTYPELRDAEKVQGRQNLIAGGESNLIFVQHTHREDDQDSSKVNYYEIAIVVKIVQYLLLQGYRREQIVVLTPYLAQLRCLRSDLLKVSEVSVNEYDSEALLEAGEEDSSTLSGQGSISPEKTAQERKNEKIRAATVDNFQGEEADIIVASLVRSNERGQVGFLKEPERINVLLSRARLGMIIVGNAKTLENSTSPDWKLLLQLLKGNIYPGFFPAYCSVHLHKFLLTFSDDTLKGPPFSLGCGDNCGEVMECGHTCPNKCHPEDGDHAKIQCQASVEVNCPKRGHRISLPCHLTKGGIFEQECREIIEIRCKNGHVNSIPCGAPSDRCEISFKATCPRKSDHFVEVPCHLSEDFDFISSHCETEVEISCQNGHTSRQKCNAKNDLVCGQEVEAECKNGHVVKIPCNKLGDLQFIAENCACEVERQCPIRGHPIMVPCSRTDNLADLCEVPVDTVCCNGHIVKVPCRQAFLEPSQFCQYEFEVSCTKRRHLVKVHCSKWPIDQEKRDEQCKVEVELTCTSHHVLMRPCRDVPVFDHVPECVEAFLSEEEREKTTFSEENEEKDPVEIACSKQPECVKACLSRFEELLASAIRECERFTANCHKFDCHKFNRTKLLLDIIFDPEHTQ